TAAERRLCHIGLLLAIDAAITKAALGRKLSISKQAVEHWEIVPAEKLVAVERATGVYRHQLRPDIFKGYVRAT
ncbi:MAG: YdaS family helix-turn-helix protein, partial [Stellaceae bacterium]